MKHKPLISKSFTSVGSPLTTHSPDSTLHSQTVVRPRPIFTSPFSDAQIFGLLLSLVYVFLQVLFYLQVLQAGDFAKSCQPWLMTLPRTQLKIHPNLLKTSC